MEAFSLAMAFLVILFAISFVAFRNASNVDTNLPPGDSGWPVVGETLDFVVNPEKFISDRMKKHSPDIFRTNFFGEKIVIICGPNGHKFLFSNEDKHFTAYVPQAMQKLFLSSQPKTDKLYRDSNVKLLRSPGFLKPEAVVNYVPGMDSIIQKQLKTHLEGKTEVKIHPFSRSLTLTLACRFFLGIENPERVAKLVGQFDIVTNGIHSLPLNVPGTAFYYAVKAAAVIRKELADVVAEKKARVLGSGAPTQDLCTTMIVGGYMPDEEISEKLMGFLVAGYSTVATTLTFFMKLVGERPDVYHKILSEQLEISESKKPEEELLSWNDVQKMKYAWAVVCEAMRVVPPVLGTFREAITDFSYAGYTVPKGWKVFWTVNTTQRNPEYFQEPNKFDPSRFMKSEEMPLYTYVPFGGGPRMCPGKEYARLAILTFVHYMVKKFKWELIEPNEKILGSMVPLPEKGLPVRLHPRYV
ncbi:beta-amyrin 28-monooxygenase-like [Rhododendron vialii]|uniref:beta-amyrin 28-monooxygenase-like n=1 Tax=Rhododendron vialii TaxID=182163 RepID=UPI00265F8E53|nr:beta-amyrin 28-monooxygenase-like [Rhododendron vialii]